MASRRQLEAERRSDAVDIIDRPKLNDAASSNLTESHRAKQAVPMDLSKQEGRLFHIKVTSIAIRESKSDDKNTKDAAINMLPLATLDFKGYRKPAVVAMAYPTNDAQSQCRKIQSREYIGNGSE